MGTVKTTSTRPTTTRLTQKQRVLQILSSGKTLTQAQARATYRIQSLSSRVNELRNDGVNISSVPYVNRSGQTVVRYAL